MPGATVTTSRVITSSTYHRFMAASSRSRYLHLTTLGANRPDPLAPSAGDLRRRPVSAARGRGQPARRGVDGRMRGRSGDAVEHPGAVDAPPLHGHRPVLGQAPARDHRVDGGHLAHPVTRCAASLPEMSTIGTPTPGWVPEPTKTTFDSPLWRVGGRNGPVWKSVCAAANGVPAAIPAAAQSAG